MRVEKVTEAQFSRKLLRALRERMPEAVIFKHADRFITGMPDASITFMGITSWFELKVNGNNPTAIQWETLRKLIRGYIVRWNTPVAMGTAGLVVEPWHVHIHEDTDGSQSFEMLVRSLERICRSD